MNTNTTILKRGIYTAVAIALSAFGASAWATSTWNVNLLTNCSGVNGAISQTCAGTTGDKTTSTIVASGWSKTGSANTFATAAVYEYTSSGLGVVATGESSGAIGDHAIDNANGTDALMLNFSSAVNLAGVRIGWNGTDNTQGPYDDSDLSVFAWTGSGLATMSGVGGLNTGWTLIGNYADVGRIADNTTSATSATIANTADLTKSGNKEIYSSYWLISAYNSTYGTTATKGGYAGSELDSNYDSFKVLSVAGNTCTGTLSGTSCNTGNQTPEPGSLALLGAGVVGLLAARRRKAIR